MNIVSKSAKRGHPSRPRAILRAGVWAALTLLILPSPVRAAGSTQPPRLGSQQLAVGRSDLAPPAESPPSIALSVPGEVPLGSDVSFSVTFNNNDPADVGYGPVLDVVLDTTGNDGDDGLGTTSISASYAGNPFTTGGANPTMWILTFDAAGEATHPIFRDSAGDFITVTGTPGDTLVVLRLPFGSFSPEQPPATVEMTVNMSTFADIGVPLDIQARGGYEFGYTPLDDWCCGDAAWPDAVGGWTSDPVIPTLLTLSKTYSGPEDETATGPNFPRQYTVSVGIAPGQSLTSLEVNDLLQDNMQFDGLVSASPAGAVCGLPGPGPGGALTCSWPAPVSNGASLTFEFHIPLEDAGANRVVDSDSGDDVTSCNQANASANWLPLDPADQAGGPFPVSSDPAGCEHTLTDKSIAIQKGVANLGGGVNSAGDTLEYSLAFQVSDFFAFDGVEISDGISDGQQVDGSFTPTLQVSGNSYSLPAAAMTGANYDVVCNYTGGPGPECTATDPAANDGTTTLVFRVSDELVSRGQPLPGRLIGGCVDPSGGSGDPDCGVYDDGPTTGVLRFRTIIQDDFTDDFPSGDPSVDQGDVLDNGVTISGFVLNTGTLTRTGGSETDTSGAGLRMGYGDLTKTIYSLNGVAAGSGVEVKPGDRLTYRIRYQLPTSDVENLQLEDYLPLPVFHVDDPDEDGTPLASWSFDPSVSTGVNDVPDPGTVMLGPQDTFYQYTCTSSGPPPTGTPAGCLPPTLTHDSTNNLLTMYFGDFSDTRHQATTVDLLFTVTVSDEPFADRLFLTNQVQGTVGSTNAGEIASSEIVQIVLTQPVLRTSKGVIWTSNANDVFDPDPPGPVSFLPPSSAPRWAGLVNSTNLTASPIDSDVSGVDAGDIVSFAIAIENTGSSLNGAFDIVLRDDLPAEYQLPAGGPNLQVYYGDGSGPIAYGYPAGGPACAAPGDPCGPDGLAGTQDDLFGYGIQLVDPVGEGVCSAHDPNLGNNIILVSFDLQLRDTVTPGDVLNTSELVGYAGGEGGPNHLAEPDTDTAQATIEGTAAKALVGTEIDNAVNGSTQAVIGELVSYRLTLTIPEGVTPDAQAVDTLDAGLAFVQVDSVTLSPGLSTENAIGIGTAPANVVIGGSGSVVTFNPGDVTNVNRDNTVPETLEIVYTAVVLNVAGNQSGTLLNNHALFSWNGGGLTPASAPNVTVIEPAVAVDKTAVVNGLGDSGDAGDPVVFTITLQQAVGSQTDAFDIGLTDSLPQAAGGESLIAGAALTSVVDSAGSLGLADFTLAGDDATGYVLTSTTSFDLPPGRVIALTISGLLSVSVEPGTFTNTAIGTWTSLDGDPGARSIHNAASTERTGTFPIVQPNDYTDTGAATINVNTSPSKLTISTSELHTGVVGGREPLAIGEIVRYRLEAVLPEGTSTNLQLVDLLPQGLLLLDNDEVRLSFTAESNITESPDLAGADNDAVPPTFVLPAGRIGTATMAGRQQLTFGLGNLVNNDNDAGVETITLEFNALVDNSLAGSNDAGDNRDNSFTVWAGGVQVAASNTVLAGIVEPSITNLVKTVVGSAPQDAGDTVAFRITYSNPAGLPRTTAFDARLTDTLDANLALDPSSVTVTLAGGAAGVIDASASNTVDVTIGSIPAGGSVQIDFTATVINNVLIGIVIPNNAALVYTSLPGPNGTLGNPTGSETPGATGAANGERGGTIPIVQPNDYSDIASVNINLTDPAVSKSVAATSVASTTSSEHNISFPDLVIGEEVTFQIVVTLPEGQAIPLVITDNLPTVPAGALELLSSQVTSIGANISTTLLVVGAPGVASDSNADLIDDRVTFDFGSAVNTPDGVSNAEDQIVLQVVARLSNLAGNQDGVSHVNLATLTTNLGTSSATASVEVVEPFLQLTKTADDDTPGLGQTVVYTLTVEHLPSSTADAQDLVVVDVLPVGVSYVDGSAAGPAGWSAAYNGLTRELTFQGPSVALVAGSAGLSYQVSIDLPPSANVGDVLVNNATMTWTSLSGPDAGERTGAGGVNDYTASASESLTVTGIDLVITKDDGVLSISPNSVLAYTLSYQNVGNAMAAGVTITDVVPDYTTFNPAASTLGWLCSPSNNAGSTCTLLPGDLGPGASGSATFAVTVDANVPVLVTLLENTASITDDGSHGSEPTPENNTDTETTPLQAAPDLTITKDDGLDIVSPGSLLVYAINYANVGDQDATGVVVSETVPVATTFDAGASLPTVWSCADGSTGGTACTVTIGDLPAGAGGSLSFAVRVDDPVAPGTTQIVDTIDIADDGANGPDPTPENNTDQDTDNLVTLPNADLTKSLIATNQAHTLAPDIAIGEILTYELVLTIPQGTMTSATLVDVLDLGLAFVDCQAPTVTGNLITTLPGGFADVCNPPANPTVGAEPPGSLTDPEQGRRVVFDLGTISNPDASNATLTLIYDAVVIDNPDNARGVDLNNDVTWVWVGGELIERAAEVTIVEPTLTLAKDASPRSVPPGGVVIFTLTIDHPAPPSDSPAFDLELSDTVPVGMTYVPGSLTASGGGAADDSAAPALRVTWPVLDLNETVTATFQATMGSLPAGSQVRNDGYLIWSTLPGDVTSPQSAFNLLSTERVYDPPINANITVTVPPLPGTGFAPGRVTALPLLPDTRPYADLGGLELEIPSLDLRVPIVGVPSGAEGWDLTWLWNQAGHLEGTAYPGWNGNSALTAHVYRPDGRPGPFVHLGQLGWDDRVIVHANGQYYEYRVRQIERVPPGDLSVLRHEGQPWLTMITCQGYDDAQDKYLWRLAVRAVLVEVGP